MKYSADEIVEVVNMFLEEDLDIRSVTLSVNTLGLVSDDPDRALTKLGSLRTTAEKFVEAVRNAEERFGVRITTKRLAVSPVQHFLEPFPDRDYALRIAKTLDELAVNTGLDYVSGFSAYADRGISKGARTLLDSLADALNSTSRLSGMVNAGSTLSGLNSDAVRAFIDSIFVMRPEASARTAVMVNVPPDSPFVPSAHHAVGMPEAQVNVAISGPGVIESLLRRNRASSFRELYELVKRAAFKITRLGELIGRYVAEALGVQFGSVDISVAPSPKANDSVAGILEAITGARVGSFGTLTALAIMMDAVKKGGAMATSNVGGLSSAFIPVSEDYVMSLRAKEGSLTLKDLLYMTAVCNSGIDMVGISKAQGKIRAFTMVMDVLTLGVVLEKITGVRAIPLDAPPGSTVDLGGLLGTVVVMDLAGDEAKNLFSLSGFIPSPLKRLDMG